MTRVLFWNIQQFGLNKVRLESRKRKHGSDDVQQARMRLDLILRVVKACDPDVFIVVEVSSRIGGADRRESGQLIDLSGIGWQGSEYLYDCLTDPLNNNPDKDWRMVPPLVIGKGAVTEAVTVYYRGSWTDAAGAAYKRYFTGPNLWTGGEGGRSERPQSAAGEYPDPVTKCLQGLTWEQAGTEWTATPREPRQIPIGALHNAGQWERRVAARTSYKKVGSTTNEDVNFGVRREPYMCTFSEFRAGQTPQLLRHVTVFGVHAPPNYVDATNYMSTLACTKEIMDELAPYEVRVLCGDFNLNLLAYDETKVPGQQKLRLTKDYEPLTKDANYQLALRPRDGVEYVGSRQELERIKGYFATLIAGSDRAVLWSRVDNPAPYPGYFYIGSELKEGGAKGYSIDNILIKTLAVVEFNALSILNTVVGAPLNKNPSPPQSVPINTSVTLGSPNTFSTAEVPWPTVPNAPNWTLAWQNHVLGDACYGHLRSTSDHLPIFTEV